MKHFLACGLAATLSTLATADSAPAVPLLPRYQQECAACHMAFPPAALPEASWRRLLGDLQHHFGTDASLDSATVNRLSDWLGAHAGTRKRAGVAPPDDRITRSAWFIREHDEVPAAIWKRPAVKSPANCAACHLQAEQGDFRERTVRIPR